MNNYLVSLWGWGLGGVQGCLHFSEKYAGGPVAPETSVRHCLADLRPRVRKDVHLLLVGRLGAPRRRIFFLQSKVQ